MNFYSDGWKANSTNSVIPTNSRPFANNDTNISNIGRTPFRPNPIKHWRKQLKPYYPTISSKQASLDMINAPTSVVHTNSNEYSCITDSLNSQLLKENIMILNNCIGLKDSNTESSRCIGGSYNITRSASTNLKPNYYRNYHKYLQSKCKTYERNQLLGEQNSDGTYASGQCSTTNMKCNKPIIYKPSNKAFMNQGSVSSSTNTLRKRNNAMTNNSASLKTAYGKTYVHIIQDTDTTPYKISYIKGDNTSSQLCRQQFKSCNTMATA